MTKHHAYTVKWRDSCSFSGWRSIDADHTVAVIASVGWVVKQTPKSVTITTSFSENGNVSDAMTIPREAIVKMRKLPQYVLGK